MIKKLIWTMAVVWVWSAGAQADFVAYNDFGGSSGGNTTAFTLSQSGLLKNYSNGTNTAVTLNVVSSSPPPASDGATGSSPTGGDAFTIFNGKINMAGYIFYNTVPTPYTSVRLDFTGMDPNKTYELVLSGNRDNAPYTARFTQYTISDVSSFTNAHSNGTTTYTVTSANDSVKFNTGYNTVNGYVARWVGIKSGPDGDMSVTVTAAPASGVTGDDGRWYLGGMRMSEASYDFQQGVNNYGITNPPGTVDTFLHAAQPNTDNSATNTIRWDGDDLGGQVFGLIRFDNIFGNGAGQIPAGTTITSATLIYNVVNLGDIGNVNEVTIPWAETDTYNNFGGEAGVQADEYGASVGNATGILGINSLDVTSSLATWSANTGANHGWIFRPTNTDGVQFSSKEDATASLRPRLIVVTGAGAPSQKTLLVKHQPYLQLGNAPLVNTGAGIGTTDQMVIAWQTIESGSGAAPNDYFEAEYRHLGDIPYIPVTPVNAFITSDSTRTNRYVTITGLNYDDNYEYHVTHKRNPSTPITVTTYNGSFHTRKHPSSTGSFSFAAYGDSADKYSGELPQFESVASRVSTLQSAFVMLLGDNIYPSGSHDDLDARLEGAIVPNNSAYLRNHIEYFCMGNHDNTTNNGQPSLDNYFCPIPVLGVTSPVAPASGETAEKNYSFDYGLVHFTVIDSCAWGGPGNADSRQAAIVNWMTADLAASHQPWKLLIAHHPPKSYFSHADADGAMACEVLPAAIANGADMLLVGHSHDYQRSFPITGHSGAPICASGDVIYTPDQSGAYTKGAGLLEIVAGTGGKNMDGPAPTSATSWLAKAFGNNNGGEVGPLIIDVTPTQLTMKYTAASNGAIKDQYTISAPGPSIVLSPTVINRTVFLGDNLPDDSFTVKNGGTGTINYSINDNALWLSQSPTSGSSTGELDTITISYSVGSQPGGNYSGTITVSAPEAGNSPQTVTVNVNVVSVRPDFDLDGDVDQTDFAHLQECFSGTGIAYGPGCANADLDVAPDSDVDAQDFAIFLNCATGPNVLANRTCDD